MKISKILAAFALLFAAFATPALAASPNVAIINPEVVIGTSKVGQYIATQLTNVSKQIDAEFEPEVAPLRTEGQQLKAEMSALSPETLRTRTDLLRRAQTLQQKGQELSNWKERQMVATRNQALQPVLKAYEAVVKEIIAEKKIDILLPADATLYHTEATDISKEAITKLDAQLTTTPVTRVRVPRVPQQQQQAAQ